MKKRMTSPISKRSRRLYKEDAIILEFKRLIEMLGVLPKREKSVFQSKVREKIMLKYKQKFLCQKTAKANLFLRILITKHNYTQLACTMADTVLGNSNNAEILYS